jgi:hypothetical protein
MGIALGLVCAGALALAQDPPLADVIKRVDARLCRPRGMC